MSRCYCHSTRTDEITSLHQIYQCHGSAVLRNSSTVGNFKLYVFFWVFPRRLRTSHPAYEDGTDSVPKRRHTIRRRGNTQKNTYEIQNTAKV